jgi:excisionase family DNA binding protein
MLGTITETANPVAISVEQASQASSLSKPFLRNEIRAGKLRVVRPGNSRRVLIMMSDFMDYLKGDGMMN